MARTYHFETPAPGAYTVRVVDAEITTDELGLHVRPIFEVNGERQPGRCGWGLNDNKRDRALAARLARAITAGAAYSNLRVCVDVNGNTYACGDTNVLGRRMNADLKRLGF